MTVTVFCGTGCFSYQTDTRENSLFISLPKVHSPIAFDVVCRHEGE